MPEKERSLPNDVAAKRSIGFVTKAWFQLTIMEEKAVIAVLALALLGVAVKYWHVRQATATSLSHDAQTLAPYTQGRNDK